MKLRTVTLILLFGAVAWCRAQDVRIVTDNGIPKMVYSYGPARDGDAFSYCIGAQDFSVWADPSKVEFREINVAAKDERVYVNNLEILDGVYKCKSCGYMPVLKEVCFWAHGSIEVITMIVLCTKCAIPIMGDSDAELIRQWNEINRPVIRRKAGE